MALCVTVIGTGYLGATHAVCLAESGCDVLGVDADPTKVAALSAGSAPFYEPRLGGLLSRHLASGRLRFTTSMDEVAEFGDVHFLSVGTPQRRDNLAADLSQLDAALDTLAPRLQRQCLVVGRSTVPVGTTERMAERLARLAPAGPDVDTAWNPEFLREGHAVEDTLNPSRIVAGVRSEYGEKLLRSVYARQIDHQVPFIVTDPPTAELTKMAANALLATRLSFMNAMADMCDRTGADVTVLADAVGYDPRIGRRYLEAGVGFGGGCLPKDIRALSARAKELGVDQLTALLAAVDAINVQHRSRTVALAAAACGGSVVGRRVCVLGAAFKPGSDDVRDSPALEVAAQLHLRGAQVTIYDPVAEDNARKAFPALTFAESAVGAAKDADIVLHLTEWEEFATMDPRVLGRHVARRYIIDGRNSLDADRWQQAGWTYQGLGRPVTTQPTQPTQARETTQHKQAGVGGASA